MDILSSTIQNFTVKQSNNQAQLTWTLDKNSPISRFAVERSSDGINFIETAAVAALAGNPTAVDYHYSDAVQSLRGLVLHYRLRMEDQQGKVVYSAIRSLRLNKAADSVEAYPNPTMNHLVISMPSNWIGKQMIFELIDQNGIEQLSFTELVKGSSKQVNLSQVKPGFYYIQIRCNGVQLAKSILKR